MKRVFTFKELKLALAQLEETYLVELLNIESDDLVNRFEDIIERDFDRLQSELEEFE